MHSHKQKEINSIHYLYNCVILRAVKLYKSLGFQHEGTCKEAIFRNGTWHDIELFALFQRNYK